MSFNEMACHERDGIWDPLYSDCTLPLSDPADWAVPEDDQPIATTSAEPETQVPEDALRVIHVTEEVFYREPTDYTVPLIIGVVCIGAGLYLYYRMD